MLTWLQKKLERVNEKRKLRKEIKNAPSITRGRIALFLNNMIQYQKNIGTIDVHFHDNSRPVSWESNSSSNFSLVLRLYLPHSLYDEWYRIFGEEISKTPLRFIQHGDKVTVLHEGRYDVYIDPREIDRIQKAIRKK